MRCPRQNRPQGRACRTQHAICCELKPRFRKQIGEPSDGTTCATLFSGMMLVLRITLGAIFAILGVVGSLLPILPGWAFFFLSALVLFPRSRFAIKAVAKIEPRMPRLVAWLRRVGIGVPDVRDVPIGVVVRTDRSRQG
jgi:hypothetical protein